MKPSLRRSRLLALVLAALLLLLSASSALANGKPVKVVLTYLPELSNAGPQSATGVAEIVMAEGEARLSLAGLPPLESEVYAAWLLNSQTRDALRVATFNTDATRSARVANVLPTEIPDKAWNVVLLTIEPNGNASQPGPKRSIAGYFPEATPGSGTPQQLPRTGGEATAGAPATTTPAASQWLTYLAAAIVGAVLLAVAYGLGLSQGRR